MREYFDRIELSSASAFAECSREETMDIRCITLDTVPDKLPSHVWRYIWRLLGAPCTFPGSLLFIGRTVLTVSFLDLQERWISVVPLNSSLSWTSGGRVLEFIDAPEAFFCIQQFDCERLERFSPCHLVWLMKWRSGSFTLHAAEYAALLGSSDCLRYLLREPPVSSAALLSTGCLTCLGDKLAVVRMLFGDASASYRKAFCVACKCQTVSVLRYFLENGCPCRWAADGELQPIHCAASGGHVDSILLLIEHGADILETGPHGATALHFAVESGNVEAVRLLLNLGAAVLLNAASEDRLVPVQCALQRGSMEIVDLLVDAGSPVLFEEGTLVHCAVEYGQSSCVEAMLREGRADPNVKRKDGAAPLHLACQSGDALSVRALLHAGAAVDTLLAPVFSSPLEILCDLSADLCCVRLLLEHGAKATSRALSSAKRKEAADVVRLLKGRME